MNSVKERVESSSVSGTAVLFRREHELNQWWIQSNSKGGANSQLVINVRYIIYAIIPVVKI